MGIQDRDYYRDDTSGYREVWGRQGVAIWIIAITCGVFFGQVITGEPNRSPLVTFGALRPDAVQEGEVWRLITPVFLHSGLFHLFANMLILYFTGTRMEERYGSREFLAFYLLAGLFSSTVYFLAAVTELNEAGSAIGASGAVMAVFILYAIHYPRQQVLLFFVIPMPIWALVILYLGFDIWGASRRAFGIQTAPIGYMAHLGGALFGALYYKFGLRITDLFAMPQRSRAGRVQPKLRVVPTEADAETPTPVGAAVENQPRAKEANDPVDEQLEARLDQVLEKVSQFGQESLTPEEREILFRASEIFKKRRK